MQKLGRWNGLRIHIEEVKYIESCCEKMHSRGTSIETKIKRVKLTSSRVTWKLAVKLV